MKYLIKECFYIHTTHYSLKPYDAEPWSVRIGFLSLVNYWFDWKKKTYKSYSIKVQFYFYQKCCQINRKEKRNNLLTTFLLLCLLRGWGLTLALKMFSEPLAVECMDLRVLGSTESTRQTMETHWPLMSESPTNTNLLFLSLSSNVVHWTLLTQKEPD